MEVNVYILDGIPLVSGVVNKKSNAQSSHIMYIQQNDKIYKP